MPRFDLESYVQVKDRIKKFRADHPEWALRSAVVEVTDQRVIMHGWVEDEMERVLADGHAEETRGSSNVNTTSALENCETSAWGRALAALGYEVDKSIASREEMEKAERPARAPRRAKAESTPAVPASPPGVPLEQLQAELWSTVNALDDGQKADTKAWLLSPQGVGHADFSRFTEQQVEAVRAYVDGTFGEQF